MCEYSPLISVVIVVIDVSRDGLISDIKLKVIKELMRRRVSAHRDFPLKRCPDNQHNRDQNYGVVGEWDLSQYVEVHLQNSLHIKATYFSVGLTNLACNSS